MQLPIGINITQLLTALLIINSCDLKNLSSSSEITLIHMHANQEANKCKDTHMRMTHTHRYTDI